MWFVVSIPSDGNSSPHLSHDLTRQPFRKVLGVFGLVGVVGVGLNPTLKVRGWQHGGNTRVALRNLNLT